MYADAVGSFRDQSTEQISRACHVLNVDGDSYEAFLQKEYNSEAKAHLIIAYLVPLKETGAMIREQTLLVMGAFVLIRRRSCRRRRSAAVAFPSWRQEEFSSWLPQLSSLPC